MCAFRACLEISLCLAPLKADQHHGAALALAVLLEGNEACCSKHPPSLCATTGCISADRWPSRLWPDSGPGCPNCKHQTQSRQNQSMPSQTKAAITRFRHGMLWITMVDERSCGLFWLVLRVHPRPTYRTRGSLKPLISSSYRHDSPIPWYRPLVKHINRVGTVQETDLD